MSKRKTFKLKPVAYAVMLAAAAPASIQFAHAGAGWADSTDYAGNPIKVPTYYANSPQGMQVDALTGAAVDTGKAMRKFVDPLPGLCAPGPLPTVTGGMGTPLSGKCIPVAVADTASYPDADYYEIGVVEYEEWMHADLPKATRLRGYVQLNDPANPVGRDANGKIVAWPQAHYLGPLIVAKKDRPVRIKYVNLLPTGAAGNLFVPVDTTLMGAGMGPDGQHVYTQNRAEFHLHGGDNPWISDGTPHQWIAPADEATTIYKVGDAFQNVPDMPDPGAGAGTLYWPNEQSGRLMFYHDHSAGITRLNVYVGEAAGYLLVDDVERGLMTAGVLPKDEIPLVIQDRTFVPQDIARQDAKWDTNKWGQPGDLWFPHVYEPNQDPNSFDGTNPPGRFDYGPWFWPIFPAVHPNLPEVSTTPEAFHDTPIINGTAYPTVTVEPKAYRFRILNAANDRFLNLSLFQADPTVVTSDNRTNTEVKMVPAVPTVGFPADWPTDGREGGVPDPAAAGPDIIAIGNEAGLLPQAAVIPAMPVNFEYNRRSATVLNIWSHGLYMGPAERADVVIDFSQYAGKTLILYNDMAAPVPAFDPRIDYYTGSPDQTGVGGAPSTQAGFGPNTRTIMQIKVADTAPAAAFDVARLQTELPKAYAATQPKPIVPQAAYNQAFGTNWGNTWARIYSGSLREPTLNFTTTDQISYRRFDAATQTIETKLTTVPAGTLLTDFPVLNKAIAEEFEAQYGRMNATLGIELPLTNFLNQTTMWVQYVDPATETVLPGETQIWKITHNGVDTHPVHFHLVNVQVINRVGWDGTIKPPLPNEVGWKETVKMNPLEDIIVAARAKTPRTPFGQPDSVRLLDPTQPSGVTTGFTQGITGVPGFPTVNTNVVANFGHEYVWHCHILGHEENDMMRPLNLQYTAIAPAAPTILAATPDNAGNTVALSWTDPTPVGSNPARPANLGNQANEVGFKILRAPVNGNGSVGSFVEVGQALANATSYTDKAPSSGYYAYQVAAFNPAGSTPSATSNVTVGDMPQAPNTVNAVASLSADQTTVSVSLSWADNSTNESGFTLQRCTMSGNTCGTFRQVANLPANTTAYVDNTVAPRTSYQYRVRATSGLGNSPWVTGNTVTTPDVLPATPGNVTATVAGTAKINVAWADNADNETGMTLQRCEGIGCTNFADLAALPTNATSYSDTTVVAGTSYSYRVQAANAVGNSGWSNVASATAIVVTLGKPSGMYSVLNAAGDQVTLNWGDTSTGEQEYRMEVASVSASNSVGAYTTVATLPANATSYGPAAIAPNARYSYRVSAWNGATQGPTTQVRVAAMTAPSGAAAVTGANPGTITLSWTNNSAIATGYRIQRLNGTRWETIGTVVGTANTAYTDSNLTSGNWYYYRVQAMDSVTGASSGWSNAPNARAR